MNIVRMPSINGRSHSNVFKSLQHPPLTFAKGRPVRPIQRRKLHVYKRKSPLSPMLSPLLHKQRK